MNAHRLVLRDCEVGGRRGLDVSIEGGRVVTMSAERAAHGRDDVEIDAGGAALLPGLHDHHLHLFAEAALRSSVPCGPPEVVDQPTLARTLRTAALSLSRGDWIRGVAYDSRRAGRLDRTRLDAAVDDRPVRVKDRTGLSWTLNTEALRVTGLETRFPDGVLVGEDRLLQEAVPAGRPDLGEVSASLCRYGITGVTDTTPGNTAGDLECMRSLAVRARAMAPPDEPEVPGVSLRTMKVVLREDDADVEELATTIEKAHAAGWSVAVHAVTRTEIVAAVAAFAQAGTAAGDRLEHASVVPAETIPLIADLGLTVVTHPDFVARRGDVYLADVDPADHEGLYRLRSLLDAGVAVGAGSDAPVGVLDPWSAMSAAVSRAGPDGMVVGAPERLSPELALSLFLGPAEHPGGPRRTVRPGDVADLCLLGSPWAEARRSLSAHLVRATIVGGDVVWMS
ncbi:MAG TPA: amidohydrolase family protein [Acidimicrobiales bacterium]